MPILTRSLGGDGVDRGGPAQAWSPLGVAVFTVATFCLITPYLPPHLAITLGDPLLLQHMSRRGTKRNIVFLRVVSSSSSTMPPSPQMCHSVCACVHVCVGVVV